MKKRVADIIIETLLENGITDCFSVVGGGSMHLNNAMLVNSNLNKYFQHHEQACAMSAEAYARLTGKTAAVCVTSGPGATNTLTGVMGAWQDSLPMIVISGQVRHAISVEQSGLALRYRGIQEFEIIPTIKNMTKYAKKIIDPLTIKVEISKALKTALDGRRGPVWLDIPMDVQSELVDVENLYQPLLEVESSNKNTDEEMKELIKIIRDSKRPCILAGSGIVSGNARDLFELFVNKMQIPVIGGAWVADVFYTEHPFYFGASGNIGPRTGNLILQNSDLIISLGNSLGFRQTGFNQEGFARNAKIVMIDADENEHKKPGLRVNKSIICDIKDFFVSFQKYDYKPKPMTDWIDYCNELKCRFSSFEAIENINMDDRVCSYYFWYIFQKYEPKDSILALGNNTANTAKLQIGKKYKEQRVLTNYTCGSMGYDLPAAIGATIASKKPVYCITGDGSIMMNLQEMQTIAYHDLPINIIIFSNDGYGAIRQTSKSFFNGQYIGCTFDSGISFPSFEKIADIFGFQYFKCKTNQEVKDNLEKIMSSENRYLLEIEQNFDDPIIPKVMSKMDEQGKMQSPALEDMYPFLQEEEYKKVMKWS